MAAYIKHIVDNRMHNNIQSMNVKLYDSNVDRLISKGWSPEHAVDEVETRYRRQARERAEQNALKRKSHGMSL